MSIDLASLAGSHGRGSQQSAESLRKSDLELAPYLLARKAVGKPITGDTLEGLRRANETAVQVRDDYMVEGRSNVKTDLSNAGENLARRTIAARQVYEERSHNIATAMSPGVRAGFTAFQGSGHCDEHALVSQPIHSYRLLEGENVQAMMDVQRKHCFDVFTMSDGTKATIDPWAEGPSVLQENAEYLRQPEKLVPMATATTPESAPTDQRQFERGLLEVGPHLQPVVEQKMAALPAVVSDKYRTWDPEPAIRPEFAKEAKQALKTATLSDGTRVYLRNGGGAKVQNVVLGLKSIFSSDARKLKRELPGIRKEHEARMLNLAAQTLQELGASESTAQHQAPNVLDQAKHLRRLGQPRGLRPEAQPEPSSSTDSHEV